MTKEEFAKLHRMASFALMQNMCPEHTESRELEDYYEDLALQKYLRSVLGKDITAMHSVADEQLKVLSFFMEKWAFDEIYGEGIDFRKDKVSLFAPKHLSRIGYDPREYSWRKDYLYERKERRELAYNSVHLYYPEFYGHFGTKPDLVCVKVSPSVLLLDGVKMYWSGEAKEYAAPCNPDFQHRYFGVNPFSRRYREHMGNVATIDVYVSDYIPAKYIESYRVVSAWPKSDANGNLVNSRYDKDIRASSVYSNWWRGWTNEMGVNNGEDEGLPYYYEEDRPRGHTFYGEDDSLSDERFYAKYMRGQPNGEEMIKLINSVRDYGDSESKGDLFHIPIDEYYKFFADDYGRYDIADEIVDLRALKNNSE